MKLFRLFFLFFYLSAFVFLNGCKQDSDNDQNIVAEIGNYQKVTFNELNKYVHDWFYNKKYRDKYNAYNHALRDMINNKLKRIDFFERGMDKDKDLTQYLRRAVNEELVIRYFRKEYLGKYVNDEAVKDAYNKMGKVVVYKQIVLNKPPEATKVQLDSLKKLVLKIQEQIRNGVDFDEMINKYSQDKKSTAAGGYMPPLTWEKSLSTPASSIIFDLNAGDIRSLEEPDAFSIVKVIEKQNIEVEPLQQVRADILETLEKRYLDASLEEFDKDKKAPLENTDLEWNEDALQQLLKWSEIKNFYKEAYKDTLQHAISDGDNFTILTYNGSQVDLKEYLRLLNNILTFKENQTVTTGDIKNFIIEAVRTDLIVKKAQKQNLGKEILTPDTQNPVLREKLTRLYNMAAIESQIPDTTDENLHRFYNSQKDSLYHTLPKVNIYVMTFSNKEKAKKARDEIKKGTPFEKVTGRYLVKTFVREEDGTIKLFRSDDKPYLGKDAFSLDESEVAGPIEYNDTEKGKQFAVIKCSNKEPGKQLTYNDVETSIANDFTEYYYNKINKKIINELRNKYDVKIYEDVLKNKLSSGQ